MAEAVKIQIPVNFDIVQAEREIRQLQDEIQRLLSVTRRTPQWMDEATRVLQRFDSMMHLVSRSGERGFEDVAANADKLRKAIQDATVEADRMGQAMVRVGYRIIRWTMAVMAVSSVLMMIRRLKNEFVELQRSLVELEKAAGRRLEFDTLEQIATIASRWGKDVREVADGAKLWLQQGYALNDALKLVNLQTALMAVASMDASRAVDFLTSLIRNYNMTVDDAASSVATLYNLHRNFAATASEVAEASKTLFPIMSQLFGATFEEVAALMAALEERTRLQPTRIARAMRTFFAGLLKQTKNARDARKSLMEYGIALYDTQGRVINLTKFVEQFAAVMRELPVKKRIELLQAFAGVRRMEVTAALQSLDESYRRALETALQGSDTLKAAFESEMEAYDTALRRTGNTIKMFWALTVGRSLTDIQLGLRGVIAGFSYLFDTIIRGASSVSPKLGNLLRILIGMASTTGMLVASFQALRAVGVAKALEQIGGIGLLGAQFFALPLGTMALYTGGFVLLMTLISELVRHIVSAQNAIEELKQMDLSSFWYKEASAVEESNDTHEDYNKMLNETLSLGDRYIKFLEEVQKWEKRVGAEKGEKVVKFKVRIEREAKAPATLKESETLYPSAEVAERTKVALPTLPPTWAGISITEWQRRGRALEEYILRPLLNTDEAVGKVIKDEQDLVEQLEQMRKALRGTGADWDVFIDKMEELARTRRAGAIEFFTSLLEVIEAAQKTAGPLGGFWGIARTFPLDEKILAQLKLRIHEVLNVPRVEFPVAQKPIMSYKDLWVQVASSIHTARVQLERYIQTNKTLISDISLWQRQIQVLQSVMSRLDFTSQMYNLRAMRREIEYELSQVTTEAPEGYENWQTIFRGLFEAATGGVEEFRKKLDNVQKTLNMVRSDSENANRENVRQWERLVGKIEQYHKAYVEFSRTARISADVAAEIREVGYAIDDVELQSIKAGDSVKSVTQKIANAINRLREQTLDMQLQLRQIQGEAQKANSILREYMGSVELDTKRGLEVYKAFARQVHESDLAYLQMLYDRKLISEEDYRLQKQALQLNYERQVALAETRFELNKIKEVLQKQYEPLQEITRAIDEFRNSLVSLGSYDIVSGVFSNLAEEITRVRDAAKEGERAFINWADVLQPVARAIDSIYEALYQATIKPYIMRVVTQWNENLLRSFGIEQPAKFGEVVADTLYRRAFEIGLRMSEGIQQGLGQVKPIPTPEGISLVKGEDFSRVLNESARQARNQMLDVTKSIERDMGVITPPTPNWQQVAALMAVRALPTIATMMGGNARYASLLSSIGGMVGFIAGAGSPIGMMLGSAIGTLLGSLIKSDDVVRQNTAAVQANTERLESVRLSLDRTVEAVNNLTDKIVNAPVSYVESEIVWHEI